MENIIKIERSVELEKMLWKYYSDAEMCEKIKEKGHSNRKTKVSYEVAKRRIKVKEER